MLTVIQNGKTVEVPLEVETAGSAAVAAWLEVQCGAPGSGASQPVSMPTQDDTITPIDTEEE